MGVKKTCVVKFIRKGDKGDKGNNGRLPIPYGQYDSTVTYVCTETLAPYVLEGNFYYVMNKTTSYRGATVGRSPAQDYAAYGQNATWILLENYKAIFVELLMANLGLIGKAVFYGQYMFSQYGKIGSTEVSTEGNYAAPVDAGGTFDPNFIVDFLTGELRCNRGEFAGGLRIPFKKLSVAGLTYMYSEVVNYGSSHNTTEYHYTLLPTSARYIDLTERVKQYTDGVHIHIPANPKLDGCRFAFYFEHVPFGYDWGSGLHFHVPTNGAICSDAISIEKTANIDTSKTTYRKIDQGGLTEAVIRIDASGNAVLFITNGDVPNLNWYAIKNNNP